MYFHNIFQTAKVFLAGSLQNFSLGAISIPTEVNRNNVLEMMILKKNQSVILLDRIVSKRRA
jgi:hypothetical protein